MTLSGGTPLKHSIAEGYADVGWGEGHDLDLEELDQPADEHLENLLEDEVSRLGDEHGFQAEVPSVSTMTRIPRGEEYNYLAFASLDEQNYELVFSEPFLGDFSEDVIRENFFHAFQTLVIDRLEDVVQDSVRKLESRYPGSEVDISGVLVEDKEERTFGSYKPEHCNPSNMARKIAFDWLNIDYLELRKDGKGSAVRAESVLRDRSDHEVAHGIKLQNSKESVEHRKRMRSEITGEYMSNLKRAPQEAITMFEERMNQDLEDDGRYPGFAFANPVSFRKFMDPEGEGELLYTDPYKLGEITAYAVDGAMREVHGDEEGRRRTREYLLELTDSPEEMQREITRSLEVLGLPDYHELYREKAEDLEEAGDPDLLVRQEAEDPDEDPEEAYWSLRALKHAYDEKFDREVPEEWYQAKSETWDELSPALQ